jgi:hypothetical protein
VNAQRSSDLPGNRIRDFDALALHRAMNDKRQADGLSWQGVADACWALCAELNADRDARGLANHPISPSTIANIPRRRSTSCQHALFFLRWLGRTPESFLVGAGVEDGLALPACDAAHRLRWNLKLLHAALNDERGARGLTWTATADQVGCHASQLTGLKTARFGTGIGIAMRSTQWLERPAADFIQPARW